MVMLMLLQNEHCYMKFTGIVSIEPLNMTVSNSKNKNIFIKP